MLLYVYQDLFTDLTVNLKNTYYQKKYLWAAFGIGFVLLNIVLLVPVFEELFQVAPLTLNNLLTIYGLSLCTFIVVQVVKFIREKLNKNKIETVQESNKENKAA